MPAEDIGGAAQRPAPDDLVQLRIALTAVAWHALLSQPQRVDFDVHTEAMKRAAALLKQLTKDGWL